MDITVSGKPIKAIAVPSKQGWLYTFDRMTGEPVWPIVEKPVEKGTVPSEWYSPTQPFPTRPAPFDRQGVSEADLIDWTPEIKAEAVRIAGLHKIGPIFTPPIVAGEGGKAGTADAAQCHRRRELGRRRLRSRDRDRRTSSRPRISHASALSTIPSRSNMNYIQGGGGGGEGDGGGGGRGGRGAAGARCSTCCSCDVRLARRFRRSRCSGYR